MDRHFAGGFLYNPAAGKVLLHLRGEHAAVDPGKWAFFGGRSEGAETGLQTFLRELAEELGVALDPANAIPLDACVSPGTGRWRHVFYAVVDHLETDFDVREGQAAGWFTLAEAAALDLTSGARRDLETFARRLDRAGRREASMPRASPRHP